MDYKIKEASENPRESVIEMTGKPIEFSLYEMEGNLARLEKNEKEMAATIELNAAKMDNIERNHPFVKDMSEQDLFTAHMYQEAKAIVKVGTDKLKEIQEAQVTDKASMAEVFEKMPEFKEAVEKFDTEQMEAAKPKHAGEEIKSDNN